MIAIIDNYDSFVFNLARYFRLCGAETTVYRNDDISADRIRQSNPQAIVISPGPCTPDQAGISCELIRLCGANIPILGVCLGHQCIGQVYGATVKRAAKPVHGKSSVVKHNGSDLFRNIPKNFRAGRYHSLIVETTQASEIDVLAETHNSVIMAIKHKKYPVYGVQFHPESILTKHGVTLIENFLAIAREFKRDHLE